MKWILKIKKLWLGLTIYLVTSITFQTDYTLTDIAK